MCLYIGFAKSLSTCEPECILPGFNVTESHPVSRAVACSTEYPANASLLSLKCLFVRMFCMYINQAFIRWGSLYGAKDKVLEAGQENHGWNGQTTFRVGRIIRNLYGYIVKANLLIKIMGTVHEGGTLKCLIMGNIEKFIRSWKILCSFQKVAKYPDRKYPGLLLYYIGQLETVGIGN